MKIKVEYIESKDTELEFARLSSGKILSFGRSMPF